MRFNGNVIAVFLIRLLLQAALLAFSGIALLLTLCVGCELPIMGTNSEWCQEPNFFYRFRGMLLSIPTEFHTMVGDFTTATEPVLSPLDYLVQVIQPWKPVILMLSLTAFVACVVKYITGTPIFIIVATPTQPPLATPRACTVMVMGGG
jgi:hypothetical protein